MLTDVQRVPRRAFSGATPWHILTLAESNGTAWVRSTPQAAPLGSGTQSSARRTSAYKAARSARRCSAHGGRSCCPPAGKFCNTARMVHSPSAGRVVFIRSLALMAACGRWLAQDSLAVAARGKSWVASRRRGVPREPAALLRKNRDSPFFPRPYCTTGPAVGSSTRMPITSVRNTSSHTRSSPAARFDQ